jgi:hypothetical protein
MAVMAVLNSIQSPNSDMVVMVQMRGLYGSWSDFSLNSICTGLNV